MVDERRGPTLPDASEDNRKEEVDTALVAHSVLEACQGFKNPSMRREFVIVSGDRDMRPAVDIIYGGDYPAPIHAWAWKETVSNVYKDLHRSWKPVTLHFLDDHLDCIRDKGKETLEEEKNGDNGFQLVFPSRKRRGGGVRLLPRAQGKRLRLKGAFILGKVRPEMDTTLYEPSPYLVHCR
jgi:hypothetical protein